MKTNRDQLLKLAHIFHKHDFSIVDNVGTLDIIISAENQRDLKELLDGYEPQVREEIVSILRE